MKSILGEYEKQRVFPLKDESPAGGIGPISSSPLLL